MENKKRLIYADDIVKVAEHAFNEWNLAMAASDGDREINHVFKMQELCKAVKAVAENAPTVDAVEVVRCKDCNRCETFYPEKQADKEAIQVWFCKLYRNYRRPNDFCSYGERKEDVNA